MDLKDFVVKAKEKNVEDTKVTLYIFTYTKGKAYREEKEVFEKPRLFVDNNNGIRKYYNKDMLDILTTDNSGNATMISLDAHIEPFIRKVIEWKKSYIETIEAEMKKEIGYLAELERQYTGVLTNRVEKNVYNAVNFIKFKTENDKVVGQKEDADCFLAYPLHTLVSGDDFLEKLKEDPDIEVYNIFVNGNATNLALEGFSEKFDDNCMIKLKKLAEINKIAKLEIDIKTNNFRKNSEGEDTEEGASEE